MKMQFTLVDNCVIKCPHCGYRDESLDTKEVATIITDNLDSIDDWLLCIRKQMYPDFSNYCEQCEQTYLVTLVPTDDIHTYTVKTTPWVNPNN